MLALTLFYIRFWYLRCCGCPWNRGRQHLAMPLKTCHDIEAGFLQGGCSVYPQTQRWRHLRLRRSRTWAVCLPLSPQKGDHPPSHDDNFLTSVCRWLPQKPTASQVEAARNPEKGGLYSDLPTPRWTIIQQYGDWYNGRWWVGCYIWYSEAPPSHLLVVPNVAHPSMASVPNSYHSMWHYKCLSSAL